MPILEVEEILVKYKKQEEQIETVLRTECIRDSLLNKDPKVGCLRLTIQETRNRNKLILKEQEVVKGNLRSKAIFSPMELQWEKVFNEYQINPSLPIITWIF
ncbi:hypothetical protein GWI33_020915 [Rhynchophorus ferrugineus]|uniref:Uncharacterized protein n=1 Tax=Rhynchophorus ferrugineus TaxID=354439 RepID=A0A834M3W3_RHYFE|nr:hypothetical protein GWI33_020915 [Rhynchophorus ferrugineus]